MLMIWQIFRSNQVLCAALYLPQMDFITEAKTEEMIF
jgi:hypothetical protein